MCANFGFAALVLGPGHEPIFEPTEARRERDPGGCEHDHAGEQLRHVEGIRRLRDQPPESCARAEQLRHHHADEAASDPELEPGDAPNERSISMRRSLVVRRPASVLMVTGNSTRKMTTSTFDQMPIPSQRMNNGASAMVGVA